MAKPELITFTCEHTAPVPRNMGRGAARLARLAAYTSRPCLECRLAREAHFEASLTLPRTAARTAAARAKIRHSY